MKISRELRFSVMSAPIAASDRRALSQAWYSALYGAGAPRAHTRLPAAVPAPQKSVAPSTLGRRAPGETQSTFAAARAQTERTVRNEGLQTERRAARSQLARRIEMLARQPRASHRAATFELDGAHGRVRVLVRCAPGRVHLIAICSRRAKAAVASALAQARYALAPRGIAVPAQTREETAC